MVDLEKSRLHLQSVLGHQGRPARRHRSHCKLKAGAVLTTTLSETASEAESEALPGREALDAFVGASSGKDTNIAAGKSLLGSVVSSEIDDEIDDFLTWTLFGQKEEGQA